MNPDFEILAPAGSFEILKAVIDAGADAVYLGGEHFGARAYANNFSKDELIEALDYAHIRNRKIYLTVNTLFKNEELSKLYEYLLPYYEHGLDAVLVQDFGALTCIHDWFFDLPIHTSTQMTVTGADGVRFLQQYGVTRVVMAREASIEEMRTIHRETGMELEAFVHGALCYCYSGQCLFSSMLGGRSGNRGRCAQPCRLPYTVLDDRKKVIKDESYILSLKDLCGLKQLLNLKEAGVYSLKIEGRMKQASYAAGVVSMYRKYVDLLADNDQLSVSETDMHTLYSLGNRCGFTESYFSKQNGEDMVTYEKPSFSQQNTDISMEKQYLPIEGNLKLKEGQPAVLTVSCPKAGQSVKVSGQAPEQAQKQPITEEEVRQRLCKTKNSAFLFEKLSIEMEENLFLPNGAINQLKRDAISMLEEKIRMSCYRKADSAGPSGNRDDILAGSDSGRIFWGNVISLEDRKLLPCALKQSWAKTIYLDAQGYGRDKFFETLLQDTGLCHRKGKKVCLILPAVFRRETSEFYFRNLEKLKAVGLDGFVVKNYEELFFVKNNLPTLPFVLDHNLYTCNDAATAAFYKAGASCDTIPLELNRKEIAGRKNDRSQMIVYGYYPLMVSAQCVNRNAKGCDHCPKVLFLKDRYHKLFPVKNYCSDCYNIIYNSVPTMLFMQLSELQRFGVGSFRLHFTMENEGEMEKICRLFEEFFLGTKSTFPQDFKESYTSGHYKRGVE